ILCFEAYVALYHKLQIHTNLQLLQWFNYWENGRGFRSSSASSSLRSAKFN
ncbi:hypothetical protein L9F63_024829, partial [Diploptera punctata]